MDELLSLKWNNHCSTFLHVLGSIRNKQKYTDVTLACGGKFFNAHRVVLSTCSDYFEEIFDHADGKALVVVLKDITPIDLELLLDYMYLGEVSVKQTDLSTLLKAAECLQIKGLAVADDDEIAKKDNKLSSKKSISPTPRRKRKAQEVSEPESDSYSSGSRSKRQQKPSSNLVPETVDIDYPPNEAVHIKEEVAVIEPDSIGIEDICKEEFSLVGDMVEESTHSDPPDLEAESKAEHMQDNSTMEPTDKDHRSTFSAACFQAEPTDWSNDDSSLSFPNTSDYGPAESSGQATADYHVRTRYCTCCRKTFANTRCLRQHMRIHTGEKPFPCQFCSYKAGRKDSLQYHHASKHGFFEKNISYET